MDSFLQRQLYNWLFYTFALLNVLNWMGKN
jgi:hypothetical protein